MKRSRLLLLILVLLVACGTASYLIFRTDPVTAAINALFPPVTVSQQRDEAARTAVAALTAMGPANVAASLHLKDLENVVLNIPAVKALGFRNITASAEQQLVRVDLSFDRGFDGEDLAAFQFRKPSEQQPNRQKAADDTPRKILNALKPRVAGGLTAYFGITSGVTSTQSSSGVIALKLLPAVTKITVQKVTLADDKIDITDAAKAIANLLNAYSENLTGYLSGLDVMNVRVPTGLIDPVDPSQALAASGPKGERVNITLTAAPITSPVFLSAVAWVIDEDKIIALARFETDATEKSTPEVMAPASVDMAAINAAARKHLNPLVGDGAAMPRTGIGVSKTLLSHALNNLFAETKPCISVDAVMPRSEFEKTVDFPDENAFDCTPSRSCSNEHISCTPTRNCSNDQMSCPLNQDTRECRSCSRYKILQFHGIKSSWEETETCVNNPACEGAKATQNALYASQKATCELDKSNWKLDCERIKGQEKIKCEGDKAAWKLDCERIKGQEKLLCETKKEAFKRLARTGKFGRLEGKFGGQARLKVCMKSAKFGDLLDSASLQLEVSGGAELPTSIKFTPLDIVGHLACQAPWTEDETLSVALPLQAIPVNATMKFAEQNGIATYQIGLSAMKVRAKLDPDPTELLLRSKNFTLSCLLVAGMLTPTAVSLKPLIPQLQGEFNQEIDGRSFGFTPELPVQKIGGQIIKLKVQDKGRALLLEAELKK